MIEIIDTQYLTSKEAAKRYGYSSSWFQMRRSKNLSPKFIKFHGKGKVLYPLKETDEWFKEMLKLKI